MDFAPRGRVQDYEDLISRLDSVPILIEQTIALLQKGLEAGITPPRITLRDVPQQIKNQMSEEPEQNAMLRPFREFPSEIPKVDQERLRKRAATALRNSVIPAFGKLYEFFEKSYLPKARESIALSDLPDGKAWYAHNVRTSTTTSMSPKEIHELGLAEVKRLRQEMDALIERIGFKGNFADFCKYLRTDPKFYYSDADSLVRAYRNVAKQADPELAHLFGKLPRLPYGVQVVPAYAEKSQTTAYYEPGSPQAGRPGWYMVNTYALNTRPKW